MNKLRFFLFAPLAFLAGGCMTGPDYAKPEMDLPDTWASERAGGEIDRTADIASWWNTLNDAQLDTLVQRSVENNHDVRIAAARVREARAAMGIANAALWPSLGVSGSYARRQSAASPASGGSPVALGLAAGAAGLTPSITVRGENGSLTASSTNGLPGLSGTLSPGGGGPDRVTDLYQAGFDASWELDIFGGNRRAVEAALAQTDAAEEFRRDVVVTLVAEVARQYVELRAAQRRLEITHKNIAAQATTVELTQSRAQAGLASELDMIRAQALLASTQSQVPLVETLVRSSIYRLSVLLGVTPGALIEELKAARSMPEPPGEVPVGLPSDLLRRRPDIRQAERELAASTARIGVAMADLFPKFSLTGSFGGANGDLGSVLSGGSQIWSFGPGIRWPIFEGGRIRANIEVQNARQEQALLTYEGQVLLAFEEVENGLVGFAQEQTRRQLLAEAVRANEEAVKLANERYVRGLDDFLNVLQAQQQLFLSEDSLVESDRAVLTNLVALYKALGGGWPVPEGQ
ncbi:MAG: efflux transporter outer membrane subunit [Candidatus Hydrogenedentes bacterium]|nr:efflux transporter outer membrane subunit [Candidatus Hydrogenedentota bacterium]